MKVLPKRPSLDHLRQQAKDLHSRRRATDPAATLADAQSELAEEYGFRTWSELKAEVDRVLHNQKTVHPDTANRLADAFDLGTPTGEMVGAEQAWAGEIWLLPTDSGTWAATELFDWTPVSEVGLSDQVRLVEAARSAGVVTPRPVRSRQGEVLVTLGERRWRVHEHIKLGPASLDATPTVASTAGEVLGVLHRLALPTEQSVAASPTDSIQARWLSWQRSEEQWRLLVARAARAGAAWATRLEQAIPGLVEVASACEDLSDEPVILSKRWFVPDNVRPGPGGVSVVLGWDHAGAIPKRQELGDCLAAFHTVEDPGVARAFMAGYRRACPDPPPLGMGMFTTAISAAQNWLATRIEVALYSEDSERRQLAEREVPGLLASPPSLEGYRALLDAIT
ncbi:MAG TPA: phosphotransferase [Acidimicrobiales bacterium]|nr:phosphotransferase [Acidimicrobiales bacterium]